MNENANRKKIIENYVDSYNDFDVDRMLKDLDERIVFKNVSGGELNLLTNGIDEFRRQAELAKEIFAEREQKITGLEFGDAEVEARIAYRGTVAVDLPNGMQAGDRIELDGRSIFRFAGDRIVEIEDIS